MKCQFFEDMAVMNPHDWQFLAQFMSVTVARLKACIICNQAEYYLS